MALVKDATVVSGEVIDQRQDPSIKRAESYARLVAGLAQVGEVRVAWPSTPRRSHVALWVYPGHGGPCRSVS